MLFYPIESSHAGFLLKQSRKIFAGHAKFVCIKAYISLSLEILYYKRHEFLTFLLLGCHSRCLNTGYTMPVAETASNFNELIIVNDAIAKSEGEEKVQLIESQLQDCAQIIVDIYSRFLFEDEVIRRRKNTFLFANDLEQIMLNAQKEAFGDGLDESTLHPYMWCCKSHYYSAGLSYYNFPYAFGGLFSRGLYAKYLEEGESFLPKYRALLKATTVTTVENVAGIAGIDLTKPEFWRQSLQMIADQIDEFIAVTSK